MNHAGSGRKVAPSVSSLATARALYKAYGPVRALCGVDLELPAAHLNVLVGANGSGKTTFMRCLGGLTPLTSGSLRVLGKAPDPRNIGKTIGWIGQELGLDPELTGYETARLVGALCRSPRRELAIAIEELANELELSVHLDRRAKSYSGGLRRRLHVLLGLLHARLCRARLLLVDEPMAGLDAVATETVWRALARAVAQGTEVVVVDHELGAVERHAGFVALFEAGRIVAAGAPTDLIAEHAHGLVRLELDPASEDAALAGLEQRLRDRSGSVRVTRHHASLLVELAPNSLDTRTLLQAALEVGIRVERLERHPPDLRAVYERLTGREVGTLARACHAGGRFEKGRKQSAKARRRAGAQREVE